MDSIVNYWGFLTACILLNLAPGSDTIYIITRTIAEGKKSGIVSALGIQTGCSVMCWQFRSAWRAWWRIHQLCLLS